MNIVCCYQCPDRHELCWDTCEKYKAEHAKYQTIKEKARKEKMLDQAVKEVLKREF